MTTTARPGAIPAHLPPALAAAWNDPEQLAALYLDAVGLECFDLEGEPWDEDLDAARAALLEALDD